MRPRIALIAAHLLPALLWTAVSNAQPMTREITDLLSIYEPAARDGWSKSRISSPGQWERKAEGIRQRVLDMMGRLPASTTPLSPQELHRVDDGKYTRRKVVYRDSEGQPVPAWLLVPKTAGPHPAVLAAHPTHAGGKDSVVGIDGKPSNFYAKEMAECGFVVLAPDSIAAGERVVPGDEPYVTARFDKAHPEWSAMGKMLADHMRGVDFLVGMPEVRPGAIGVIGHSLGGYNAFFLAAFDPRVRAAVSSCGFTTIGRSSKPFAWSRDSWFVHFPKLKNYLRAGIVPFDFHEVMALAAPRAMFNYSAAEDTIFPDVESIRMAGTQVAEVYSLLGARERLRFEVGEGPHEFPPAVRERAYAWLREELERGPSAPRR